jgi:hypothetical protein
MIGDVALLRRFLKGWVLTLRNRTAQSRRFFMVNSADVMISVEGKHGTRSVLDLGAALEKPTLPLPFGSGISRERWHELRDEITRWFKLPLESAHAWEQRDLGTLDHSAIGQLARSVKTVLLNGFTRNCFVMMPFGGAFDRVYDEVIRSVLAAHQLNPVRADRLGLTGNGYTDDLRALRARLDAMIGVTLGKLGGLDVEVGTP